MNRDHLLFDLGTIRSRMDWASAAVLCVLATGFALAPRLRMVEPLARADEVEAPAVDREAKPQADGAGPQADQDAPFTATFSNGVKVQLIGLSENPSKGKAWWAPDGTRIDAAPYDRVPAIMHADENGLAPEVCFRWMNLPEDPDFANNWNIVNPRTSGMGGGNAYDSKGQRLENLTAWAVNISEARDTCSIQFSASIGDTPWLTVFTAQGGNLSSMGGTIDGVRQGAIFGKSRAQDGGTEITVSYEIPGMAVRLLAVANDGLPDIGTSTGGAGVLGFSQVTYRFARLAPGQIQRFELQSQKRQFETIEFRNVSLHPDKPTKVEIVRLPAEKPKQEPARASNAASAATDRYRRSMELVAELAKEHGYRLEHDQPLKRIPPPFLPARDEYWAMSSSPALFSANAADAPARKEPVRPGFMIMQWTGNNLQPNTYHMRTPALGQVLDDVFNLKLQDLKGDLRFIATGVPGDWVVNWDSRKPHTTNADEIAALERILRDELGLRVRLKLQIVGRKVYVAKGSYKFTAIVGPDGKVRQGGADVAKNSDGFFHIPLRRDDTSMSVGTYEDFLHTIGEIILTPIVDEATVPPAKESLFWSLHGDMPKDALAPFDDEQVNELLASITKQTGLTFTKEVRVVPTLFIVRDAE